MCLSNTKKNIRVETNVRCVAVARELGKVCDCTENREICTECEEKAGEKINWRMAKRERRKGAKVKSLSRPQGLSIGKWKRAEEW